MQIQNSEVTVVLHYRVHYLPTSFEISYSKTTRWNPDESLFTSKDGVYWHMATREEGIEVETHFLNQQRIFHEQKRNSSASGVGVAVQASF